MPAPPTSCASPDELGLLARDAAQRAEALLSGRRPPDPDPIIDVIRLLHGRKDPAVAEAAAQRAGLSPAALTRLRAAYTFGGAEGVRNAHYPAPADPATMDDAVQAIEAIKATPTPSPRIEQNRITYTTANVQIRLGINQRWYPYTRTTTGNWAPAPGHSDNPADAYLAAVQATRRRTS